jgi:hypothetical protein
MAIASFADLRAYLERTGRAYEVSPDGTELLRCQIVLEDQKLVVAMRPLAITNGSTWLGIGIRLCPLDKIRPIGALVANSELAVGALARMEDEVVLRMTCPFNQLPEEALERILRGLVTTYVDLMRAMARVEADPTRETAYGYLFR